MLCEYICKHARIFFVCVYCIIINAMRHWKKYDTVMLQVLDAHVRDMVRVHAFIESSTLHVDTKVKGQLFLRYLNLWKWNQQSIRWKYISLVMARPTCNITGLKINSAQLKVKKPWIQSTIKGISLLNKQRKHY